MRSLAPILIPSTLPSTHPTARPRSPPVPWRALQLSVLRLFETVLSDVAIRRNPEHADLLALAKDTTRHMFAR
jgi:hypothetical protein